MKLLGEKEIEGILHRLDRLTQEEGRVTMAQTLEIVYGLVNNVEVVINGTQTHVLSRLQTVELRSWLDRWKEISGRHLEGFGWAFTIFRNLCLRN